MADIVIRGVDMPKGDLEYVSLWVYGDGRVYVSNQASATFSQRLQDLVISLPEGHGRLIDADALPRIDGKDEEGFSCQIVYDWDIEEAPTIVPAEGGGEDA